MPGGVALESRGIEYWSWVEGRFGRPSWTKLHLKRELARKLPAAYMR